ncbi:MAG TPA: hypothetical protein P5186_20090, partial [Candidatus Paceibacterota bacterium]|nr:hypothetical protein [Candidatus Paceibacterota bacterium]
SHAPAAEVDAAIRELSRVLSPLLAQLDAFLNSNRSAPPAPAPAAIAVPASDPAQVRTAASQLAQLLAAFDPGALEFIETHRILLQSLFSTETWGSFEKLVQSYAFADAQAQLTEALEKLPAV